MPITFRIKALRLLGTEYDKLCIQHSKEAPRNAIPVGGGDWMDLFFKMEGVRGTMSALENGKKLERAFEEGKLVSETAIRLWNRRREWQVHRWDKCVHSYLETLQRKIRA